MEQLGLDGGHLHGRTTGPSRICSPTSTLEVKGRLKREGDVRSGGHFREEGGVTEQKGEKEMGD